MPSTLCSNRTAYSDGSGIFDSRFTVDDLEENGECHYLETCCEPENIISKEESQSRIEDRVNEDTLQQCIQQCKVIDEPFSKKLPLKIHSVTHQPITGCGFRNKHGIGLELTQDPNVAQFGEFPWHLALKEKKNSKFVYICGASLIHPQVALTSAHCVYLKESANLRIRAGEWDTQTINEPFSHSDHNVLQVVINPEFNSANMFNDVALVVLENLVTLSAHINTICLPPYNFKFNDQICFASGWGRENFHNESAYRVNLKKIKLSVLSLRSCQESLRQTKLGDKFKLHTSFLCAGGEKNVDTCVGT